MALWFEWKFPNEIIATKTVHQNLNSYISLLAIGKLRFLLCPVIVELKAPYA